MSDNGTMDKVGGKVKETAGKVADKPELRVEGKMDQVAGKAKEIFEDAKDFAVDAGEKIAEKAGEAKDAAAAKIHEMTADDTQ